MMFNSFVSQVSMAARTGNRIETVKSLLDSGANINEKNWRGATALMSARYDVDADHVVNKEIAELLINRGADVNIKDRDGNTALMLFVESFCDKYIIELLLNNGANINETNLEGKTALMLASCYSRSNKEKVKLLLDRGADVNIRDKDDYTALMLASSSFGFCEIVKLLTNYYEKSDDFYK